MLASCCWATKIQHTTNDPHRRHPLSKRFLYPFVNFNKISSVAEEENAEWAYER